MFVLCCVVWFCGCKCCQLLKRSDAGNVGSSKTAGSDKVQEFLFNSNCTISHCITHSQAVQVWALGCAKLTLLYSNTFWRKWKCASHHLSAMRNAFSVWIFRTKLSCSLFSPDRNGFENLKCLPLSPEIQVFVVLIFCCLPPQLW